MAKFTNEAGREFRPRIDVGSLRRVREATGFELAKVLDDDLRRLREIAADPELFARVLFVLCGDEAKQYGEDAFQAGLCGDALVAAWDAFMGAYADFCPSHRRDLLRRMAEKAKQVADLATEQAAREIDAIDPAAALAGLASSPTPSGTPTGSRASSGSTPAP